MDGKWFGVACCPTNIARTLASLDEYVYFSSGSDLWVNMYVSGQATLHTGKGNINLTQETRFPFKGRVNLHIRSDIGQPACIAFHVPAYAGNFRIAELSDMDKHLLQPEIRDGYAYLEKDLGDTKLEVTFDILPHFTYANPQVRADAGKVAVEKGPLVTVWKRPITANVCQASILTQQPPAGGV